MYRFTRHQASAEHEQARDGVELVDGALGPGAHGQVLQHPALADPVGHERCDRERGGDRRALEVLALARGVLGHVGHADVEAREPGQAAEHEEREEEVVDGRAEADGERGG